MKYEEVVAPLGGAEKAPLVGAPATLYGTSTPYGKAVVKVCTKYYALYF